jgi:hypothetical protein
MLFFTLSLKVFSMQRKERVDIFSISVVRD